MVQVLGPAHFSKVSTNTCGGEGGKGPKENNDWPKELNKNPERGSKRPCFQSILLIVSSFIKEKNWNQTACCF